MAIRIPILTSFDPKGLRQANAQLGKLSGSVSSLGRNFAVAGAAIAGAGALIAKNAQALARIETINAQTAQTIKSMGNVAGISAKEVETLAGSLEALTATEAESIQEGANLLLTFKNIQNQAGAGNDIFNQTTAIMVDLARAMGTSAAGEAIRLGKALNDPVKGIAALTRVGVSFTEQQKEQIKALANSGDLMGAQKIILAELQAQFGGSGQAFAQTFTGQLELMGHELGTIGEEATMAVMPALQGMVQELRALIPIIGPQLKAAIESVDWRGLATAVVDLTRFLIENGATIAKTIGALFLLNTAYKAVTVAVNIGKLAIALHTYAVAKAAAGMTAASITAGVLRVALLALPWVAVAAGIGLIVKGMTEVDSSYRKTTPVVTSFGTAILKSGQDAEWAAGRYGIAANAINTLNNVVANPPKPGRTSVLDDYAYNLKTNQPITAPRPSAVSIPSFNTAVANTAGSAAKATTKLTKAQQANQKMAKVGAKMLAGLQPQIDATNQANAAAAEAAAQASAAAAQAAADFARAEAEAAAERDRIYKSFADSVKDTFGGIKNSILGAFDLTQLGGSTNAITRNMDKLLTRLRSFAANVKSLATMGLNPALLQQIISAGPMAGSRLAESLVMGGAGGLSAINAGFTEFGSLSSQIAQTGTESLFNQGAQQSIYNISVDGGVGSGSTIGKAIVDAIKAYERTSGAVWQGA
jgi:hypothetical protein